MEKKDLGLSLTSGGFTVEHGDDWSTVAHGVFCCRVWTGWFGLMEFIHQFCSPCDSNNCGLANGSELVKSCQNDV